MKTRTNTGWRSDSYPSIFSKANHNMKHAAYFVVEGAQTIPFKIFYVFIYFPLVFP